MHLSRYMALRKLDDDDVAVAIDVSRPTVSRIRRGMQRPDWPTLAKLKVWSNGKITADDFLDFPEEARA
jgi:transcriptional regulator with XRE-family HTH domain